MTGAIAQLVVCLTAALGVAFESQLGGIPFVEIDYEIISKVILPLLLIQKGQLSVTADSICTSTG